MTEISGQREGSVKEKEVIGAAEEFIETGNFSRMIETLAKAVKEEEVITPLGAALLVVDRMATEAREAREDKNALLERLVRERLGEILGVARQEYDYKSRRSYVGPKIKAQMALWAVLTEVVESRDDA